MKVKKPPTEVKRVVRMEVRLMRLWRMMRMVMVVTMRNEIRADIEKDNTYVLKMRMAMVRKMSMTMVMMRKAIIVTRMMKLTKLTM